MMKNISEITRFIATYLADKAEAERHEEFQHWKADPENRHLLQKIEKDCQERLAAGRYDDFPTGKRWEEMKRERRILSRRLIIRRVAGYAACAALAIGIALLIQPAGNEKAVGLPPQIQAEPLQTRLIVGDEIINLDKRQGVISDSDVVVSNKGSRLSYQMKMTGDRIQNIRHKIVVPPGNTYELELSDGSLISLNAGSELVFPNFFQGSRREVELKGEAYFKISKNPDKPFIVNNRHSKVRVYGTEFNVSSYPEDEKTLVTLVQGKVAVERDGIETEIHPGEQWVYNTKDNMSDIIPVDVTFYTAWKDGMFKFDNTPLEEIMKSVSRWYGVDIVYQTEELKNLRFGGNFDRQTDIAPLLRIFEANGRIRIERQGNRLTIKQIQ